MSSYQCNLTSLQSSPHWCNLITSDVFPLVRKTFFSHTSTMLEPKTCKEACQHPLWVEAINKEFHALKTYNTWDLFELPP